MHNDGEDEDGDGEEPKFNAMEDEEILICPSPYDTNCRWLDIKCSSCKVINRSSKALHYSPLSRLLPKHPLLMAEEKDKKEARKLLAKEKKSSSASIKGRTNNRLGKKAERVAMKDIGAKATIASGSVCGDGDAYISAGDLKLQIEHKLRISSKGRLGITKEEWDKGKRQGIDLFVISSEDQRIVIMSDELFKTLMEIINNG
jgi:hypothetical protein